MTAYEEGYTSGLSWDKLWMPGGPFKFSDNSNNPVHVKMAKDSQQHNREWLEGWAQGVADKQQNK